MTVTDLNKGRIKITLTDKEIITLFGTYQRFYDMSDNIKPTFENILERVLISRGLSLSQELLIKVKAKENNGCVIIISPASNRVKNEYLFIFENSEKLIDGILFLFRNKSTCNIQSQLFKTESDYRLIIYSCENNPVFLSLKEYCVPRKIKPFEADYTKEHGKLLIQEKAVKIFGSAFLKGFK